jgi:pectinesterase
MKKIFLLVCMFNTASAFMLNIFANPVYDFVVAKDGSGKYTTIQEAVDACRDYTEKPYTIFIKNGVYHEKLVVPSWKAHITFIGENVDSVVITYNDYSGKVMDSASGKKFGTFTSHTCLVAGNNITFENITFVNSAGRVGQAVAMHVEGDRCIFRNCKFVGNQDTLFTGGDQSRQYFYNCYIEGTTDFIFGPATAVFENCTIKSLFDSFITAASTPQLNKYGYVFLNCRLIADTAAKRVYLGRPWRSFAATAFVNCEMGSHILPEGWHNWNKPDAEKTVRYFEYNSFGSGANPHARVAWSQQLTNAEAKDFTTKNVLQGIDGWDPSR